MSVHNCSECQWSVIQHKKAMDILLGLQELFFFFFARALETTIVKW